MLSSGTYQLPNTSSIYTTTYGKSGGKTVCVNTTANNVNVTTIDSIQGIGNYSIKCTATSNAGKSISKTVTYGIEGIFSGSYGLACTNFEDDKCSINNSIITLPYGTAQYGPYFRIRKGCYKVIINGSNFQNDCTIAEVYQSSPNIKYTLLSKSVSSTTISYYVNITNDLLYRGDATNGTGIEFVYFNYCSGVTMTVNNLTVQNVSSCPAT